MGSKKKAKLQKMPTENVAPPAVAAPAEPEKADKDQGVPSPESGIAEQASSGNSTAVPEGASVVESQQGATAEGNQNAGGGEAQSAPSADGQSVAQSDQNVPQGEGNDAESKNGKTLASAEDNDSIDWLTIVLMLAVMANIAYWIWVRDNSITGDVEMHRPPGVASAMANAGSGPPPGPNEGEDNFGEAVSALGGIDRDDPDHDMVRTYIVIANALEIAGIGDVHTVWDLDKQVLEAASSPDGSGKEKQLIQAAYDEALKLMRKAYGDTFAEACRKASPEAQQAATKIFKEAESLVDSKPLDAMARYEDALLRLRADAAFDDHGSDNHPGDQPGSGPDNRRDDQRGPSLDNNRGDQRGPGPDNRRDDQRGSSFDNNRGDQRGPGPDNRRDDQRGSSLDNNRGDQRGPGPDDRRDDQRGSSLDNNRGDQRGPGPDNRRDDQRGPSPDNHPSDQPSPGSANSFIPEGQSR